MINAMTVTQLANALNTTSKDFNIGNLQGFRKEMKGMAKRPAGPIFAAGSITDEWACHWGGRTELQFNIGLDEGGMRHGVAFSLEPSLTLPSIEPLVPKIARFNEFLDKNSAKLIGYGYEMWYYENGHRFENRAPQMIPADWVQLRNFIFLGKTQSLDAIDIEVILRDFDQLLELYFFTEDTELVISDSLPEADGGVTAEWSFKAGHTPYARSQTANYTERELDMGLRHNWLQTQIHEALCAEYGAEHVGTEVTSLSNGEIDFVIERKGWRVFAELKTSARAMTCVRDALGQLFEYAYYGMKSPPSELWIIGTAKCSPNELSYLKRLRGQLKISLFYRRYDEDRKILEPAI
jgi:hypothetical protein